ncbi:MAG: Nuclear protein SET [Parcubacteria group bacterium GW2011_GWF2_38_8]|nr:MAG: Nuclear protein SET [Parcubacteria group bacterium GW2011_GWF2_38_8]
MIKYKNMVMKNTRKKKRMFSWMNPKLEVRDTKKYGKGVFAKKDLKKDETLIVMGGYVLDINGENRLRGFPEDKPIEISEDFSFCPLTSEDIKLMPQHYVNHSCEPNAGWKGQVFMVAIRDIRAGEEIVYDYAMVVCSNKDSKTYFKMKCKCGSKNCRKIIDEEGWKNSELQKKYKGYFQWYLEEKINKNKNKNV